MQTVLSCALNNNNSEGPRDINLSISIVCLLNSMFEIYALSKTIANDTLFPVVIGVISRENIWAVSKDTDLVVRYHVE